MGITIDWQLVTTVKSFITLAHGGKQNTTPIYCCILFLEKAVLRLPQLFTTVLFYNIGSWY
jgi:hypothetical protein